MDKFTETSYTSYGENIGNSFKGIFIGLILLIVSIVLLWWNEGRSVEQATALKEMQEKIITLPDTSYNAKYDNKAVLIHGAVKPLHEVVDPEFGVKTDGLVLRKNVEMYQWKEHEESKSQDKLGGGTETVTTYTYSKGWSPHEINSMTFKYPQGHQNPVLTHKGGSYSTDGQLGDFHLDKNIINSIRTSEQYPGLAQMPDYIGDAKNYKSFLYIGIDPNMPQIGDIKITYTYAPAGEYTFAAKQSGKSLMYYTTDNGKEFLFVRSGKVSAQSIFKEELEANAFLTWILRGTGLLLMFIAFSMMMGLLATLAKVIPMLGSLVGGVTSIIAGTLTLVLGSLIIALAWFSSRPMMSLIIIAVGVGIAFALGKFGKKKGAVSGGRSTPPPASAQNVPTGSTPPPSPTPPSRGTSTPPARETETDMKEEQTEPASSMPPPRET